MEKKALNVGDLQQNRDKIIVRTSVIGILANLLLAAFKAAVGLLANSIAVVLDAVNNLTDALSSVITILGTKLAGKQPDKKHPLGYGRVEFLSAMIVAALVLYAGITAGVESVKKIISPETPDYSAVSLVIISAAVVVKLILGRYVKATGEKVHSGALTASGSDAMFDAILSASVLLSAIIFLTTKVSLEAYVGVIIAVVICKAGIEMLLETLDEILGKRVESAYLSQIRSTIAQEPEVQGVYDLILHSYGPETYIGSVHVEVADVLTAAQLDAMERRIARRVYQEHGVVMAGIGIYAKNTQDPELSRMQDTVSQIILGHEGVLQVHGFYVDPETKTVNLDVIIDFALEDRKALFEHICQELSQAYPDYQMQLTMDIDI